ncbi:hypothetical protein WJX72_006513 [[Myrmecia] bisecta]|uniref:DNA endonuclease activator Ctp1 C-terminal domain-containing protein n=1 Tax=[Myrmecia] bisecta TaxID=41462 RepID=A0AAW1PAY9_9CHLO
MEQIQQQALLSLKVSFAALNELRQQEHEAQLAEATAQWQCERERLDALAYRRKVVMQKDEIAELRSRVAVFEKAAHAAHQATPERPQHDVTPDRLPARSVDSTHGGYDLGISGQDFCSTQETMDSHPQLPGRSPSKAGRRGKVSAAIKSPVRSQGGAGKGVAGEWKRKQRAGKAAPPSPSIVAFLSPSSLSPSKHARKPHHHRWRQPSAAGEASTAGIHVNATGPAVGEGSTAVLLRSRPASAAVGDMRQAAASDAPGAETADRVIDLTQADDTAGGSDPALADARTTQLYPRAPTPALQDAPRPGEPGYKYQAVVRKKDERAALQGFECLDCKRFYEALQTWNGNMQGLPACGHAVAGQQASHAAAGAQVDREQLRQDGSRHRYQYAPPNTPDGFWDMGFADSLDSRMH